MYVALSSGPSDCLPFLVIFFFIILINFVFVTHFLKLKRIHFNSFSGSSEGKLRTKMYSKTWTSGLSRNVTRFEPILCHSVGLRQVGVFYDVTPNTRIRLLEVVNTAVFGIRKEQGCIQSHNDRQYACSLTMVTFNMWCNNFEIKCCKSTKWFWEMWVVKHYCVTEVYLMTMYWKTTHWGVFNDYVLKNYMFRPVLAIFRLPWWKLKILL